VGTERATGRALGERLLLPAPPAQATGDHEQDQCDTGDDDAGPDLGRERQATEEVADRDAEPPQHLEDADQVERYGQQRPRHAAQGSAYTAAAQREPASDQSHSGQPATQQEPWDLAK
jgi:hypothetical protein